MTFNETVIALGSNLGDRLRNLQRAINELSCFAKIRAVSSFYENKAHLLPDSPKEWDIPFLNGAVTITTELSPQLLLKKLQEIERKINTQKKITWAPREIDLDIIAYNDLVIDEPDLTIPHAKMLERSFVMHPLSEIHPFWKYPVKSDPNFGKNALDLSGVISDELGSVFVYKPYLVGIVNLTPNSYSKDGTLSPEDAVRKIKQLLKDGASYIELGAASSKPGCKMISPEEEWERLEPVLDRLRDTFECTPRLSIESSNAKVIKKVLLEKIDVSIINYLSVDIDEEIVEIAKERNIKLVRMHSLKMPHAYKDALDMGKNPIDEIVEWANKNITKLLDLGLNKDQILLDPGLGFCKSPMQNALILKDIDKLTELGSSVFIGHSRKSIGTRRSFDQYSRIDQESLGLSPFLQKKGVEYLRVHNVREHMDMIALHHKVGGSIA